MGILVCGGGCVDQLVRLLNQVIFPFTELDVNSPENEKSAESGAFEHRSVP